MAPRLAVVLAAVLFVPCSSAVLRIQREKAEKFWPFTASAAQAPPAPVPAVATGPLLADVKDAVLMSSAFGRKTSQLCQQAADEEKASCRALAGDRLFCTLMRRHEKKYAGYQGIEEEKKKCDETDIMENSVEAAKDQKLQEEADKACSAH